MNLNQIIPEQPQPSENQLSVQSETDKLMTKLNSENKALHETNKQLSEKTEQLQNQINDLNTKLSEKETALQNLKDRKPIFTPAKTIVEYKTEYIHNDKCINCQLNNITNKYENLIEKMVELALYTIIMVSIATMKNDILRNDIAAFAQTLKHSTVSFIKGILGIGFSFGSQILTVTTSGSKALYRISSIFIILLIIGLVGGILFYIIKNIAPFFKAYWNLTQTAVTIILFSLLICFADVINIKAVLNINLVVLFIITDIVIMIIRAVYDCGKNW